MAISRDPEDDRTSFDRTPSQNANQGKDATDWESDFESAVWADDDLTADDFVDGVVGNADRIVEQSRASPIGRSTTGPASWSHSKRLVLIGAGQTHLQIVNWWSKRKIPGLELTLISAFDQVPYSRLLSDALAGVFRPEEITIDVPALCQRSGIRLIVDRVNAIDPETMKISFAHQPSIPFDVASINIGSVPASEPLWQSHRIMIGIKPHATFLARFRVRFLELVEQWKMAPGEERLQAIVVGGGTTGVEMAFALEQRGYELELPIDVCVIEASNEILPGYPRNVIRKVRKLFHQRGIETILGSPVAGCDDLGPPQLILENGRQIRADLAIWAAGSAPSNAIKESQLPKSQDGFLRVRPTFQSTGNGPIFAVGGATGKTGDPTANSAQIAVDQAETLFQNLERSVRHLPLKDFQPKPETAVFLSCGDQTAITHFWGFTFHGSWVWDQKNKRDRAWLADFPLGTQ